MELSTIFLQIDPNWILAAGTIALVVINLFFLRRASKHTDTQLELTRQELQTRLRAELAMTVTNSNNYREDSGEYKSKIKFFIENRGTIPARNIRLYYKASAHEPSLAEIVKDWNTIKSNETPVPGIIPPSKESRDIPHITPLDSDRNYYLAIWALYDYTGMSNDESIHVMEINGQTATSLTTYDKHDIDKQRKSKPLGV